MTAASVIVMNLDEVTYQANTLPLVSHINVGSGLHCTIRELAETIAKVTGFAGRLAFDASTSDDPPRKSMDVSRIKALGWPEAIGLEEGLRDVYACSVVNLDRLRP
jgi:GDP-L-fucose synthase